MPTEGRLNNGLSQSVCFVGETGATIYCASVLSRGQAELCSRNIHQLNNRRASLKTPIMQ